MTTLCIPTTWRRNAMIIDNVEIMTSPHAMYLGFAGKGAYIWDLRGQSGVEFCGAWAASPLPPARGSGERWKLLSRILGVAPAAQRFHYFKCTRWLLVVYFCTHFMEKGTISAFSITDICKKLRSQCSKSANPMVRKFATGCVHPVDAEFYGANRACWCSFKPTNFSCRTLDLQLMGDHLCG